MKIKSKKRIKREIMSKIRIFKTGASLSYS